MTSFWLAAVMFGECVRQILDHSCNKTKSLTFFISSAKTLHHRGITAFGQQVDFHRVNSPAHYLTIAAMNKNLVLHDKLIS